MPLPEPLIAVSADTLSGAPVFNGTGTESCDTTGTATDSGYTEAQFNFNVATDLESDLQAEGAAVVLTRPVKSSVLVNSDPHWD